MAAPVGAAEALPGLHAGPVHAARVRDALVTVLALPAVETPAHRGARIHINKLITAAGPHDIYGPHIFLTHSRAHTRTHLRTHTHWRTCTHWHAHTHIRAHTL